MKKRTITQALLLLLLASVCLLSSCNLEQFRGAAGEAGAKGDKGDVGATGNGIESITTERVDGGTKVIIKYTDAAMQPVEFIIPDGEKGEQGAQGEQGSQGEQGPQGERGPQGQEGRGILKTEVINGCLWITFTDDPENPVNVGRVLPEAEEPIDPDPTPNPDPENPSLDLGGYRYRAYVRSDSNAGCPLSNGNPDFYCEDFCLTGEMNDVISYAVFARNQEIERTYNVRFYNEWQKYNMVTELHNYHMNGTPFDLTIILAQSAAQAATLALLRDLNQLEYLDLTHDSYDQNSTHELSMGGKLYYLSGDMNISTLDNVTATVVNLELYNQLADAIVETFEGDSYGNIYNVVENECWTLETLLKIADLASADANPNDGALGVDKGDTVGYFQYAYSTMYYFYAAGGRISKIGEDGYPELIIHKGNNGDIFNYLHKNFNTWNNPLIPNGFSMARLNNFISGSTLFTDMKLWDVRKTLSLNAPFEYGVLPNPTFGEGDPYNSLVAFSNCAHLWAIPTMFSDHVKSQQMMQIMAERSNVNVSGSTMDAYYIETLCNTAAGDAGSRAVMDIIKGSMIYDIATLYNWGNWATILEDIDTEYTNMYKYHSTHLDATYVSMENTINLFLNMEGVPGK